MENNVIKLKFGVLGEDSIDRGSGLDIYNCLSAIANKIELKVKVNVDQTHFKAELKKLKMEIDNSLTDSSVKQKSASSTNGTSNRNSKKKGKNNVDYQKTVEDFYKTKADLLKVADETVASVIAKQKKKDTKEVFKSQKAELEKLRETDAKRVEEAEKYTALLKETYSEQRLNTAYEEAEKTAEKLYDVKLRLSKVPKDSLEYEKLVPEEKKLEELYDKQIEQLKAIGKAGKERATDVKKYAEALESAQSQQSKEAQDTALNKAYEEAKKTAEKLYNIRLKIRKTPEGNVVERKKLINQSKSLSKSYKDQIEQLKQMEGVEEKRIASIKEYKNILSEGYRAQVASDRELKLNTAYEEAEKTAEKLYDVKLRLSKVPESNSLERKKLTSEEKKLEELYNKQIEQLKAIGDIDKERVATIKNYAETLAKTQEKDSVSNPIEIAKLRDKAESLYSANGFDKIISRSEKAMVLVEGFRKRVEALGGSATKKQISGLNAEFIEVEAQLRQLGRETDSFGNKIKEAFNSHVVQMVAQALYTYIIQSFKKVYQNVVELDKAVTNLQIATGYTRQETAKLLLSYADLAKQLGSTMTEVAEAADTWLRQGYTIAETNELIADSMMLSKLGQLDSSEAAKALTSAMKGYKIESQDAIKIVDKLTAVDMQAAVSAGDIATAMAETAAGADVAGVSMDKLIGYISTVAEVTQDGAESVGVFYKSLFARMGNIKVGNFVDNDTGESLNDVEKVLKNLGISLRDENKEFRDFDAVLDEVAEGWVNFTSVEQHALATAFAGTRNTEKFIVLMENYGDALNYAATAANSAGTAQSKYNEAYVDSIEAKMNALTASWEEFSQLLLDSELIKFLVSALNIIVDILTGVISFGNGIIVKAPIVVAAIIGIIKIITKVIGLFDTLKIKAHLYARSFMHLGLTNAQEVSVYLKTVFKALTETIQEFLTNNAAIILMSGIITLMTTLEGKVLGFTEVIIAAVALIATAIVIATKKTSAVIKWFSSNNPFGWILLAITVVVAAIKGVIDLYKAFNPSLEDLKETAKESKQAWEDAVDELNEVDEKLEETQNRIAELQELSNNGTITLVEQEELNKLQQSIAGLEAQKKALEDIANIKKESAEKDAINVVNKVLTERLSDAYIQEDNTFWNGLGRAAASILSMGISDAAFGYGISDWTIKKENASDYVNEVLKDWDNATEQQRQYAIAFYDDLEEQKEMLSYYVGDGLEQWQIDANNAYNTYWEYVHRFILAKNSDISEVWDSVLSMERFSDVKKKFENIANSTGITTESLKSLYDTDSSVKDMIDYLEKLGIFAWEDTTKVSGLVNQINVLADAAQTVIEISFLSILNEIKDEFDALSDVLSDIEENGIAAADSIATLLEEYPSLMKFFDLKKYIDDDGNTYYQGYGLKDEYSGLSSNDVQKMFVTEYLQTYVDELAKCEEGTENYATAQENLNNAIAVCATLLRSSAIEEETERLNANKDALEEQLDKYNDLIDIRKELLETYKEEVEYQKELAQKQKNVADLETQLAIAKLDKSSSGQAKVRELQEELESAQDELDDFTLEKAIDILTSEIDEQYSEYQSFVDEEVEKITQAIDDLKATIAPGIIIPAPTQEEHQATYGTGNRFPSPQEYLETADQKHVGVLFKYHSGGFVDDYSKLQSNEVFAKLLRGEFVSTPAQMDKFVKETLPKVAAYKSGEATINYNSPLIEIKCDTVNDDTLPKLNDIVNKAVEKIKKDMSSALSRTGYRKQY